MSSHSSLFLDLTDNRSDPNEIGAAVAPSTPGIHFTPRNRHRKRNTFAQEVEPQQIEPTLSLASQSQPQRSNHDTTHMQNSAPTPLAPPSATSANSTLSSFAQNGYSDMQVAVQLRKQILDDLSFRSDRNIIYLCDMLISLSNASLCDVYLYALCCYRIGDYLLAIQILKRYHLVQELSDLITALPLFLAKIDQPLQLTPGNIHLIQNCHISDMLSLSDVVLCNLLLIRCLYELKKMTDISAFIGIGFQPSISLGHMPYSFADELATYDLSAQLQMTTSSTRQPFVSRSNLTNMTSPPFFEVEQLLLIIWKTFYSNHNDYFFNHSRTFLSPLLTSFPDLDTAFNNSQAYYVDSLSSLAIHPAEPRVFHTCTKPPYRLDATKLEYLSTSPTRTTPATNSSTPLHQSLLRPGSWRQLISEFSYYRAKIATLLQSDQRIITYYLSKTFFFDINHIESFKTLVDTEVINSSQLVMILLQAQSHFDVNVTLAPLAFRSYQYKFDLACLQAHMNLFFINDHSSIQEKLRQFNCDNISTSLDSVPFTFHGNLQEEAPGVPDDEFRSVVELFNPIYSPDNVASFMTILQQLQNPQQSQITTNSTDGGHPAPINFLSKQIEKFSSSMASQIINRAQNAGWHEGIPSIVHINDSFSTQWLAPIYTSIIRSKSFIDIDAVSENISALLSTCKTAQNHAHDASMEEPAPSPALQRLEDFFASRTLHGIIHAMKLLHELIPGTQGLGNSPLVLSCLAESLYRQKRLQDAYKLSKYIIYELDQASLADSVLQAQQYARHYDTVQIQSSSQSLELASIEHSVLIQNDITKLYRQPEVFLNFFHPAELFSLICIDMNKIDELHAFCATMTSVLPNNASLWYALVVYYLATGKPQTSHRLLTTSHILGVNHGVMTTFISNQLRIKQLLMSYYVSQSLLDNAFTLAKQNISRYPLSNWEVIFLCRHQLLATTLFSHNNRSLTNNIPGSREPGRSLHQNAAAQVELFEGLHKLQIVQLFASHGCLCNILPSSTINSLSQMRNGGQSSVLTQVSMIAENNHFFSPCRCLDDIFTWFRSNITHIIDSQQNKQSTPSMASLPHYHLNPASNNLELFAGIDPNVFTTIGLVHFQRGDYESALHCFQRTLDVFTISHSLASCPTVSFCVTTPSPANSTVAQRSVESFPVIQGVADYPGLIINIAQCYRKLFQFPEAIRFYTYALHIVPDVNYITEAQIGLGMCFHAVGMLSEAQDMYITVLTSAPGNALIQQLSDMVAFAIVAAVQNNQTR